MIILNHSIAFLFPKGYLELNHFTCNSYKAEGMSERNVIMSNPNCCVYFIVLKTTCEPPPSIIN